MGTLLHLPSRRVVTLSSRLVVGRSRRSDLHITNRRVSAEHAILAWSGVTWELRDLGSTNGTFVDGKPLAVGIRVRLRRNNLLSFGDAEDAWRLVSDTPPLPAAVACATGEPIEAEGPLLALPSAQDPVVTVFWERTGWVVEHDGRRRVLRETTTVDVDGEQYEIQLPEAVAGTLAGEEDEPDQEEPLQGLEFIFERHPTVGVGMDAIGRTGRLSLRPRAHHGTMLHLARRREADLEAGVDAAEAGWLPFDQTARDLGIDPKTLNVHIYRVRQELAQNGICGANAVVERRPVSRELRFGGVKVDIKGP